MKEKITKIFKKVMSNMEKDHISEYSAQCSYYTILSFIPFVILLITLIQYTNIEQQTLFDAISKIIPAQLYSCTVSYFPTTNSNYYTIWCTFFPIPYVTSHICFNCSNWLNSW